MQWVIKGSFFCDVEKGNVVPLEQEMRNKLRSRLPQKIADAVGYDIEKKN